MQQTSSLFTLLLLLLIATTIATTATADIDPALCRNLTSWWCCQPTNLTQSDGDGGAGTVIHTYGPDYGNGVGTLSGSQLQLQFTNQPPGVLLNATVSADCASITFNTGTVWRRAAPPPWQGPAVPAPDWVATLSGILELNPLAYTSPAGNGSGGDGSGTWASLQPKVAYWQELGVNSLWLAYYATSTRHFYGIRSVYAAIDPPSLDVTLGTAQEFGDFVAACHAAGIKVFLDVIGHGLVNESPYVKQHPDWFAGGSWGMTDFNYSSTGFADWWTQVWTAYIVDYKVDGFRVDIGLPEWWPVFDRIVLAAAAAGHPVAVWGEGSRYHFSQHDFGLPLPNVTQVALASKSAAHCHNTVQFSCHDSGWESPPGNYFAIRGSRATFGYFALSPLIPLWLGGEEYNENPVVDLPDLELDLYGTSGKPGGWMYGSMRQWDQLESADHADMLADVSALLRLQASHVDVLHHDACIANIASVSYRILSGEDDGESGYEKQRQEDQLRQKGRQKGQHYNHHQQQQFSDTDNALAQDPYIRWLNGTKAVLVVANTDQTNIIHLEMSLPLAMMGFQSVDVFRVTFLFGGPPEPVNIRAADVARFALAVGADGVFGGGLAVVLFTPA